MLYFCLEQKTIAYLINQNNFQFIKLLIENKVIKRNQQVLVSIVSRSSALFDVGR